MMCQEEHAELQDHCHTCLSLGSSCCHRCAHTCPWYPPPAWLPHHILCQQRSLVHRNWSVSSLLLCLPDLQGCPFIGRDRKSYFMHAFPLFRCSNISSAFRFHINCRWTFLGSHPCDLWNIRVRTYEHSGLLDLIHIESEHVRIQRKDKGTKMIFYHSVLGFHSSAEQFPRHLRSKKEDWTKKTKACYQGTKMDQQRG